MDEIDPIEELHEIRRRLIEQAGGTFEAYYQQVLEQQKNNPNVVDLSQLKAAPAKPRRRSAGKPKAKATAARKKPASRKPAQRRNPVAAQ